jgi:hypothetical protein
MDIGLTDRDRELQRALYDFSQIVKDDDSMKQIGYVVNKHFILKQDVEDRIIKVIGLLKMWECESEDFSLEEQQRLVSLINEQFGDLVR